MTMGLDVGDRYSHLCLLDEEGEVVKRVGAEHRSGVAAAF